MNDLISIIAKRWVASTIAHCEFLAAIEAIKDETLREQAKSRESMVFQKEVFNLYQANLISDHIYFSEKSKKKSKNTINNLDFKKLNVDNYYQGGKTYIGSTKDFIYEHEFPVSNLQEALKDLYAKNALTVEKVSDLIMNKCRICILTREEDDWLNKNGYKTERPNGQYPKEKDGVPKEWVINEEQINY
jgi:hypothetical protein